MATASTRDIVFKRKLRRLRQGGAPRVADLFSGCGGLSLGFHAAGCVISAAVEIDELAAQSHAMNFGESEQAKDSLHAVPRDIATCEPEELIHELMPGETAEDAIDVIIGGPPCQSFARVGRAKLREVDAHPEAFKQDPRSNLYLRYLHYVRKLKPLALLMENVPDVLNFGGHNIADEVCEVLSKEGYECRYTLLNSAYYGVPQMRERMFLLAFRREVSHEVNFPCPTHWLDLPPGYAGTRQVALQVVRKKEQTLFESNSEVGLYYVSPPTASHSLLPAVTTEQAICDLSPITKHLRGELRRGARRFTDLSMYRSDVLPTSFGTLMREWPGFECQEGVRDHVIRSLPRDYQIFRAMNPGDQYPEAYRIASEICERKRLQSGIAPGTKAHRDLISQIVPPYDPTKFPNKWRKLESFLPSRTLLAHLGKDSYSHIHYDSNQARTISVREAARLQSFPDGFLFAGTMNPAFRQIGNAVPPLLANALAHVILETLGVEAKMPPLSTCLSMAHSNGKRRRVDHPARVNRI